MRHFVSEEEWAEFDAYYGDDLYVDCFEQEIEDMEHDKDVRAAVVEQARHVHTAEKRVGRTKGCCYLTHGADSYEKPRLAKRQRSLSKAICRSYEGKV